KSPVRHFVAAGKPFVRPGKQDCPSQSAFGHALDVPAEHFRLLILRMSDRVHAELAQNERTLAGEILQAQKVTFEIALIMEINVKTEKIDILRKQIFGRRIGCVGIKNIRVRRASDPNKMLNKLGHAGHTEPPRHRARDLVTDQITEHGRVTDIYLDDVADNQRTVIGNRFLSKVEEVLFLS